MNDLSVKSSVMQKMKRMWTLLQRDGIHLVTYEVWRALVYALRDQWHFTYFEYALDEEIFSIPLQDPPTIREAVKGDLEQIQRDLFPVLVGPYENDRRYFAFLGDANTICYLGEVEGRIVHYTWVFIDAKQSPLMGLPFYKDQLRNGDVFVGLGFTHPDVRGVWVYPYTLMHCLHDLQRRNMGRRVLLLVQGLNPSAVTFFQRLGFRIVRNAQPTSIWSYIASRFHVRKNPHASL